MCSPPPKPPGTHKASKSKFRIAVLVALVIVGTIAGVVLTAWILNTFQPGPCLLILPAALVMAAVFWRLRRIEKKEIQRFKSLPPTPDEEFLHALQIPSDAPEAKIAIAARNAFAKLGCVPPESLKPSHHFFPDLEKLPFYDSIDYLHMIFTLEREIGMKIPKADSAPIFRNAARTEPPNIGETILGIVELWKRQQK